MKKYVLSILIAALMIAPFGSVAVAEHVEASEPQAEAVVSRDVPAQLSVTESMTPALHAMLLAMMNHDVQTFDPSNRELVWESLYNMLSLYGQLDNRSEYQGEDLLLPSETVYDYAATILSDLSTLGQPPESLSDRMVYDPATDHYLVVCGSDGLSQLRTNMTPAPNGQELLSGELVYLPDGSVLAQYQATLQAQDNMFGYIIASMTLR